MAERFGRRALAQGPPVSVPYIDVDGGATVFLDKEIRAFVRERSCGEISSGLVQVLDLEAAKPVQHLAEPIP